MEPRAAEDVRTQGIGRDEEAGGLGKVPYPSQAAVLAAQAMYVRCGTVRSGQESSPYLCRWCNEWHGGH
jgi:hypothetical protein